MAEELWGIVIVAVISVISVVISQFLTFRSTRKQMVLQTRASYIQEQFRDLYSAHQFLDRIGLSMDKDESIATIQKMIDEHPYNFPYGFLINWLQFKRKLREENNHNEVDRLLDDLKDLERIYFHKYRQEVLGESYDELKQYTEAMKGSYREKT